MIIKCAAGVGLHVDMTAFASLAVSRADMNAVRTVMKSVKFDNAGTNQADSDCATHSMQNCTWRIASTRTDLTKVCVLCSSKPDSVVTVWWAWRGVHSMRVHSDRLGYSTYVLQLTFKHKSSV